jgi:hypothetical protein
MTAKTVTRVVKGTKGIWINEGQGFVKKVEGEKIVLTPESAAAKARYLYEPGEYEGMQKAKEMAKEAQEEEQVEKPKPVVKKEFKKASPSLNASKGAGSKES